MKKFLLIVLTALPLLMKAQVQAPGTAELAYTLLARSGWTATANTGVGADGSYNGLFDGLTANATGTYWNSNYGTPATNVYPHILTVDMLSSQTYQGVMLRPRNGSRKPQSVTFRKSDDGSTWTDIATVTAANVLKNQYFTFGASQTSRYLQVEITTGYGDNNGELDEIAPYTTSIPDNTIYSRIGWIATGSSTQGSGGTGDNGGYEATLDGDVSTYWHSAWSPATTLPQYLEYDMLQALNINKISLINRPTNTAGRFTSFTVSYKVNAGDAWTTLPGTFSSPLANPAVNNIPLGANITARYIKLDITAVGSGNFAMLAEFRAHYDNVLPVELTSFTAKSNGSSVGLKWTTATESNASHFNVTRSVDGIKFNTIGKVSVTGSGSTYNYTDFSPVKGNNYYQLETVDNDGKSEKSAIEVAKVATNGNEITITATSANSITLNVYATKAAAGSIIASNVTGQKIATQAVKLAEGNNSITIATGATKGLIIVSLNTAEGTLSKKIVK